MKKLLLVLFVFCCKGLSAQTIPNYNELVLLTPSDYKEAEPYALKAATYLLSTPLVNTNISRQRSVQFLIKWVNGTPDYAFTMDGVGNALSNELFDYTVLYLASMAKYALENPASAGDPDLVKANALKILIKYAEDPANHVKVTKSLKKLSEANAKGELEKVMNEFPTKN